MRVLLVSHRYPPDSVAGVERYTEALAAELTRIGDHVSIAARRPDPAVRPLRRMRERDPNGIEVFRLIGGATGLTRFLMHDEALERHFTAILAETAPDVVHLNHLVTLSPRFVDIAHRLRIPVVLSLHDFYMACPLVHLQRPNGELCAGPAGGLACASTCFASEGPSGPTRWGLRAAYFRRILERVERVVCYSRYVGDYFEAFGAPSERLHVVPNSVPNDLRARVEQRRNGHAPAGTPRPLRLAYCGVVVAHKGVHLIVDALRLAGIERAELVVLGNTPHPKYAARLRERAADVPGLALTMHGPYERDELPELLADVDCVVLPSQVPEAGPIAPREALACGVPVIVSKLGALPELVRPGRNGFVVSADRPAELAVLLQDLAASPELRARLRRGARESPVVTTADHAAAVRAVYERAIADHARRRPPKPGEVEELDFLYSTLHRLDFGDPPAG